MPSAGEGDALLPVALALSRTGLRNGAPGSQLRLVQASPEGDSVVPVEVEAAGCGHRDGHGDSPLPSPAEGDTLLLVALAFSRTGRRRGQCFAECRRWGRSSSHRAGLGRDRAAKRSARLSAEVGRASSEGDSVVPIDVDAAGCGDGDSRSPAVLFRRSALLCGRFERTQMGTVFSVELNSGSRTDHVGTVLFALSAEWSTESEAIGQQFFDGCGGALAGQAPNSRMEQPTTPPRTPTKLLQLRFSILFGCFCLRNREFSGTWLGRYTIAPVGAERPAEQNGLQG